MRIPGSGIENVIGRKDVSENQQKSVFAKIVKQLDVFIMGGERIGAAAIVKVSTPSSAL